MPVLRLFTTVSTFLFTIGLFLLSLVTWVPSEDAGVWAELLIILGVCCISSSSLFTNSLISISSMVLGWLVCLRIFSTLVPASRPFLTSPYISIHFPLVIFIFLLVTLLTCCPVGQGLKNCQLRFERFLPFLDPLGFPGWNLYKGSPDSLFFRFSLKATIVIAYISTWRCS